MTGKAAGERCGEEKLCSMTCCPCNLDVKKLTPLVNAPRYICKMCGRVANDKMNLCEPVPMN